MAVHAWQALSVRWCMNGNREDVLVRIIYRRERFRK